MLLLFAATLQLAQLQQQQAVPVASAAAAHTVHCYLAWYTARFARRLQQHTNIQSVTVNFFPGPGLKMCNSERGHTRRIAIARRGGGLQINHPRFELAAPCSAEALFSRGAASRAKASQKPFQASSEHLRCGGRKSPSLNARFDGYGPVRPVYTNLCVSSAILKTASGT